MSSADLRIRSAPNVISTLVSHKKNLLEVMAIPGLVGRSVYSGLASNPKHQTDASAGSRKIVWSGRPRAAVYSGIVSQRLRPARRPSDGTAASAESASVSAAPGRPVDSGRSCGEPPASAAPAGP
jgi:hypothetical protein